MPDAAELAAFDLTAEDVAEPDYELWPDTEPSVMVFAAMRTQWRVGMNGPTGLDYGVLPLVMKMEGVPVRDQTHVFNDIRYMERAALEEIWSQRDE